MITSTWAVVRSSFSPLFSYRARPALSRIDGRD
jgi:hypothetical protein